ncbi:hypothetical protein [Burkholderia stagnalis]|uniref:hypothetical protein n=1 Tax=Burkholderia stagnalis TaxID=1503054 RepID=UPI000AA75ACB|nr:hypothetical protein [Burkholderia stagnalis]VWC01893.1 cytosine deaminase [Burkholderia stagnalis]
MIGQERYGLAAGCDATFVALRAPNAAAAAAAAAAADASVPAERRVVRRGESDAGAQFTPGLRFAR